MPDVFITLPKPRVQERSAITVTAKFRDSNLDAAIPTTARYRIDCLTTGQTLKDWTSLSVAATISIAVTSADNRIVSNGNWFERKQITVQADQGTDTETRDVAFWDVYNIRGFQE